MPMSLTPDQEQEIIERNMPKICRAVDNFTVRCVCPVVKVPYEDFVQEVSIAFLEYIRKCETMEQVETFPWYEAMNAMSRLVISYQPISAPQRTTSFDRIIRSMPRTCSYEVNAESLSNVDGMSKHWVDDAETMMDLETFVDSQSDYAGRIIAMKLWGLSSRKIASEMGVTEQAICGRLKDYQQKYHDFIKEEESDG